MKTYAFGIDVGGTTLKCGLFRTDGTVRTNPHLIVVPPTSIPKQ